MAFLLRTIVLLLGVQGINSLWTVSKMTAQSGGSVSIPCHCHRLHKDLPKLWYKGKYWLTRLIVKPTNQSRRTGISFYNSPDELVTTMTMTDLRTSDSNRYWCAVKIHGSYVRTSLDLSVTEDAPDLSVSSNMVSGEVDGNVSVQCLYSDKLRDAEKKWCVSGDLRSCQTVDDIEASPSATLQMNDTGAGVYTVTLTGLKSTGAGWYWCMAGGLQAPVYVSVDSQRLNTNSSTFTTAPSFTSANSFDIQHHNPVATLVPTKPKLPEQTENPDQTFNASTKQFDSVQPFSTTKENSRGGSSQSEGSIRTPITSRSATSHFTVTGSSKELIFDPTSTCETRDHFWLIPLVCGALMIVFMFSGISWKVWSWQKKANTREEATELTTDHNVNESDDLLRNDWTNAYF